MPEFIGRFDFRFSALDDIQAREIMSMIGLDCVKPYRPRRGETIEPSAKLQRLAPGRVPKGVKL